jgi:hypothetical protein
LNHASVLPRFARTPRCLIQIPRLRIRASHPFVAGCAGRDLNPGHSLERPAFSAGTQEAHRTLQRVSRKETAYYKQYLHIVATEIVEEAVEHDCSVIAFEDLTAIRKRAQGATKSTASHPTKSPSAGSPIAIRNPNRRSPCRHRSLQERRIDTSPVRSDSIKTNSMIAPTSANTRPRRIVATTSTVMSVTRSDGTVIGTGRLRGSRANRNPEGQSARTAGMTDRKSGTFLVTHADEESAVLRDVADGQVHTLARNPDLAVAEVLEATLEPKPPMEVTWLVVDIERTRTILVETSSETPTRQAQEIAAAQPVGDVTRQERAGEGEVHVLSVPSERTDDAAAEVRDDEATLSRAARLGVDRVEIRANEGVVSVRYLP